MVDLPVPEDPRSPSTETGRLTERVSDAERDRTVTLLREHVVDGRVTLDEFSERIGLALESRTRGDLEALLADLPAVVPEEPGVTPRKTRRWHVAVMSGHSTKGRWRIGAKTNVVAVMGGCDMDLRRAQIDGPVIEITAFAFWGGVQVTVPEGFEVELRGFSFMGGRTLRVRDVHRIPGSPRIVIRGFAVMGGIEVRSRPNRSGRAIAQSVSEGVLGVMDALGSYRGPPGASPDLAALGKDIRRQLHAQRHGPRRAERHDRRSEASSPPAAEDSGLPTDGTVTILFCDMVDYAGMTERLGDQVSRQVLREHHRIVRDALARHAGREINVQGDGFMVAFGGVARALRCAVAIQRAVRDFVPAEGAEQIAVHIGIHTGDALAEGDDFLGHTVIVASRLADAAGPGEILVSSLSEQLVQGSGEFAFDGHRETHLKGMTRVQLSATLSWAG